MQAHSVISLTIEYDWPWQAFESAYNHSNNHLHCFISQQSVCKILIPALISRPPYNQLYSPNSTRWKLLWDVKMERFIELYIWYPQALFHKAGLSTELSVHSDVSIHSPLIFLSFTPSSCCMAPLIIIPPKPERGKRWTLPLVGLSTQAENVMAVPPFKHEMSGGIKLLYNQHIFRLVWELLVLTHLEIWFALYTGFRKKF